VLTAAFKKLEKRRFLHEQGSFGYTYHSKRKPRVS
jgi:hypothetical protein